MESKFDFSVGLLFKIAKEMCNDHKIYCLLQLDGLNFWCFQIIYFTWHNLYNIMGYTDLGIRGLGFVISAHLLYIQRKFSTCVDWSDPLSKHALNFVHCDTSL